LTVIRPRSGYIGGIAEPDGTVLGDWDAVGDVGLRIR
jgi:hypothetical protein